MDRIKFNLNDKHSYPITKTIFEEKTKRSRVHSRKNNQGEMSYFAICPACHNPVQIIGLYKKNEHTDSAYAKHHRASISQLAAYHQEAYDYCPYRSKRKPYNKNSRNPLGPLSLAIINKLVHYFDKIIYFLEKTIGIYISHNLAQSMLDDYFASKAYLYTGSSLINIPFMLAYFMRSNDLMLRIIKDKSLIEALEEIKDLDIQKGKVNKKSQSFIKLPFYFIKHDTQLVEHTITDILYLEVGYGKNGTKNEVIYSKKLVLDANHFENLLQFQPSNLSEKQLNYNETLLNIAKEIAKKYGFSKLDESFI